MNILKFIFIIPVLIYFSISYLGCTQDPVSPTISTVQIDTNARYNWDATYFIGGAHGMYVQDTNNIYIASSPYPVHYFNSSVNYLDMQDPQFLCYSVAGKDNEIYFGGGKSRGIPFDSAVLKKYENGNITTYSFPDDSTGSTFDLFFFNNDLWITTIIGSKVYKFSNGAFTPYDIRVSGYVGTFFSDKPGNLFLFCTKIISNTSVLTYSFRFTGSNFDLISIDSSGAMQNIYRTKKNVFASGYEDIFLFNGISWVKYLNTKIFINDNYLSVNMLNAENEDSISIYTDGTGYSNYRFYEYINGHWYVDRSTDAYWTSYFMSGSMMSFENKIFLILRGFNHNSVLMRGTLKQK